MATKILAWPAITRPRSIVLVALVAAPWVAGLALASVGGWPTSGGMMGGGMMGGAHRAPKGGDPCAGLMACAHPAMAPSACQARMASANMSPETCQSMMANGTMHPAQCEAKMGAPCH